MALTAQDKEWRAQDDARTLIEAEKIKMDAARKKLALAKVKAIEDGAKSTLKAASSAKGKSTAKRPTRTRTTKRK